MKLGICADAMNPGGRPDSQDPLLHPFDLIRLVCFEDPAFYECCYELLAAGYQVALVLARESFPGDRVTEAQIRTYAERIDAKYFVIGNEVDAGLIFDVDGNPVDSPSSWKMTGDEYSEFASVAYHTIRDCRPEALIVGAGLISGQISWFNDYHGPDLDAWDLHSYGDPTPEETRDYIRRYRAAAGCPIVMFEWARSPELIAPTLAVIEAETIANCWFCLSDSMVPPLGLLDTNGQPKPEYESLVNAASAPPAEETTVSKIEVREKERNFKLGARWGSKQIHDLSVDGKVRIAGFEHGVLLEIDGDCWDVAHLPDLASLLPN